MATEKKTTKTAAKTKAPAKKAAAKKPAAKKAPVKKVEKEAPKKPDVRRMRIKIKAYDHKVIDEAAKKIVDASYRYGATVSGPIPLPTAIKKYTVHRSPFVHEDSREQFEMRTHKRLIDIFDPNPKLIDALMSLNMPSGVDIEVKS